MDINELLIGNITTSFGQEAIQELFTRTKGAIKSISIPSSKVGGSNRGYAIVHMATADGALQAVKDLDGFSIEGRRLSVSVIKLAEQRKRWFGLGK